MMQLFLSTLMSLTTGCDLSQICPTQTHSMTHARTPTQTACHISIQTRITMLLEELLLWKRSYRRASMLQRKRVFSITSYWLVFSALCCDVSSFLKICRHTRACGLLLSHDSIFRVEASRSLTKACNFSLAEGQRLGPVTSHSRCRGKCELYLRSHTHCCDCHPLNVLTSSHLCLKRLDIFPFSLFPLAVASSHWSLQLT